MNKREISMALVKQFGFRKLDSFYIATCNPDVISGYCLDCPPGSIYLWKFLLPAFDRIEFLHLSLGKRMAFSDPFDTRDKEYLIGLVESDAEELMEFNSPQRIIDFVNSFDNESPYGEWVKLLCRIRINEIEPFGEFLNEIDELREFVGSGVIADASDFLKRSYELGGWIGTRRLLDEWSKLNTMKYCGITVPRAITP